MSEQTSHLVQIVRRRLKRTLQRVTLADLTFGLLLTLGVAAGLWLLLVAVEAGFWLGSTPRAVLLGAFVLLAVLLVLFVLARPLLRLLGAWRGPSDEQLARLVGERYPDISDRLVNLLQLAEGRRTEAPESLVDAAIHRLGDQVRPVPFEQMEDFARVRRVGRLASVPVAGLLLFLLAAPGTFWSASQRLLAPGMAFERPAPFQFLVEPGRAELVRGDTLRVTVRARGASPPAEVTLALNHLDEEHVEEIHLTPDSAGAFRHRVVNVRKALRYRASAGRVESPWYPVAVVERPLVRNLQVVLDYPAYTRIPRQRLPQNVGDVTALPGTGVSLAVGLGGASVSEAFVRFDDGRLDTLAVAGDVARGRFPLTEAGSYQILLRSPDGVENQDPITHTLQLQADAFPSVTLLEPEPDTELGEVLRADLRLRLNDDFGFSRLRLFYRLAESRFGTPMEDFAALALPLRAPTKLDQDVDFTWHLTQETELNPVPGDVIEYYAQVWDNDAVAGYKTAQSAVHRLRLPSLAEQYQQLDEAQDRAGGALEELRREADVIQERFQELRDELRRKREGDWEDRRQLQRLQEKQQEVEGRVERLAQEMETMTEQMERNGLVSDETLELFQELQQVVEEINSPALQEALRQLQEAMQDLNLQQMQEAIQDFEFSEEQYQQRLQRALDLFQNLRVQQEIEEAARLAEELSEQQRRLAEETQRLQEEDPEAAPEDEAVADEAEEPGDRGRETGDGERETGTGEQERGDGGQERDDSGEEERSAGEEGEAEPAEQPETPSESDPSQESPSEADRPGSERPGSERLAREQERSRQEMEQLLEQLEQLQEQMQDVRTAPREELQQMNDQLRPEQLPQQMQQNAEQLRQQELQPAQQGQQQMQQRLQQMQQRLQQMQQGMQGQQMQINLAGLRQALSDALTLSQQQEDLRGQVRASSADSPRLRALAQRQVELSEGLRVVSDSLQRLASDIPQMSREVQEQAGDAQREMSAATDALSDRSTSRAGGYQKGSMTHLNELALLLSDLLEQMQNASGSGGGMSMQQMLEQLQQMSGQQQQLNEQIQQMLNDAQGNRLSTDQQQRLRQMAAQQQALRQQLKELSRNRELRNQALGDLERIAEQMQETIEELQEGRLDQRVQRRQQQILTRLLNATRSLREQGREQRREGQTGDEVPRESPADLTPEEQIEQLRRALLQALESGYAPDYEELIKRYFELLQEQDREPTP